MPSRTVNGLSLNYADRGNGLPVVLLHGFPLDHRMWAGQVADLPDRCRVIAPDFRGFGQSQAAGPFTIDDLASDVHALLADLGALPCVLGGLSMGGYVALAFARRFAADLRGLMLFDTRADADGPEAREGRRRSLDVVRQKGPAGIAEQMVPKLLAPGAADGRPDVARAVRELIEATPAATIEHALVALRDRPDATPSLPAIAVPTLIVVGDGDQIAPPAVAEGMRKAIEGSTLAVIRGAGHLSPMEQPGQVSQAVRGFLQGVG